LVEQQRIDIAEESTTSVPTAKTSKKENTNESNILETKKEKTKIMHWTGIRGLERSRLER
jgi:hypothetical protein